MNRKKIYTLFFGTFLRRSLSYGIPFGLIMALFIYRDTSMWIALFSFIFGSLFFGVTMAFAMNKQFEMMKRWSDDDEQIPTKRYNKLLNQMLIPKSLKDREGYSQYINNLVERYNQPGFSRGNSISTFTFLGIILIVAILFMENKWFVFIPAIIIILNAFIYYRRSSVMRKIQVVQKKLEQS
jgi:hypothetical protein